MEKNRKASIILCAIQMWTITHTHTHISIRGWLLTHKTRADLEGSLKPDPWQVQKIKQSSSVLQHYNKNAVTSSTVYILYILEENFPVNSMGEEDITRRWWPRHEYYSITRWIHGEIGEIRLLSELPSVGMLVGGQFNSILHWPARIYKFTRVLAPYSHGAIDSGASTELTGVGHRGFPSLIHDLIFPVTAWKPDEFVTSNSQLHIQGKAVTILVRLLNVIKSFFLFIIPNFNIRQKIIFSFYYFSLFLASCWIFDDHEVLTSSSCKWCRDCAGRSRPEAAGWRHLSPCHLHPPSPSSHRPLLLLRPHSPRPRSRPFS